MTKYIGNILTDGAPTSYSCVFDGSGDYIDTPSNAALGIGSGDFTIEFFVNFNSVTGFQSLFDFRSAQPSAAPIIYLANNSRLNYLFNSGTAVPFGPNPLVTGVWYHVAWVRASGVNTMYVNGQSQTSFTDSAGVASSIIRIGARQAAGAADFTNAYISNFRFVKGTAVYTANFTPPTQLFAITNTSLLTCQQPTIIDVSSNAFAITVNGDTKVSTFTPFPAYQAYNPASGGGTPGMWSLNDAAYAAQTGLWNMYDPYWKNVTLLLNGENAVNGAQNNTFLDSSTNNFTITRNGNTTQGTFSPYGSLWSNYFDGSGDYLVTPSSAALGLGTGDFTIEAWVNTNLASKPNYGQWFVDLRPSGQPSATKPFLLIGGTANKFEYGTNGAAQITSTTAALPGTWYHVAAVRSSGVTKLYINGVQEGSSYSDSNNYGSSNDVVIGTVGDARGSYDGYMNGYVSNVRIVKGTALYTSNFTPSTTPLTAVSGTSLLTCQSNRFIDNSSNNFTLTVNGNTSVQRFSPFNPTAPYSAATIGGSGYFDGSGDYLSLPSSAAFALPDAFTFECWLYPTSFPLANTIFVVPVNSGIQIGRRDSSNDWGIAAAGVAWVLTSTTFPSVGAWNHIAIVRSGTGTNQTSIFLNGTRIANGTVSTSFAQGGAYVSNTLTGGTYGHISNLRLVKGAAVYDPTQSTITVPTAPLTAITNTSLLCNFTNAGIPDAAMMNDLETVGNAQVSTSVKKYGTGSLYFDGTGDWLAYASGQNSNFGTGDFTVEFWMYATSITSQMNILSTGGAFGTGATRIGKDALLGMALYTRTGSDNVIVSEGNNTFINGAANTWVHYAIVRSGNTFNLFRNGTSVSTGTFTGAISFLLNGSTVIGTDWANDYFPGYIDDLRITKGYARYTANFTPPTSSLQNL